MTSDRIIKLFVLNRFLCQRGSISSVFGSSVFAIDKSICLVIAKLNKSCDELL